MKRLAKVAESEAFRRARDAVSRIVPWVSLGFGLWSAFGLVRRYEQARIVAWLLAGAWLVALFLAALRWWSARRRNPSRWMRMGDYALVWTSQNLSQEILFFAIPFWVRSTTWGSRNAIFTALLFPLAATTLFDPFYFGKIAARTRLLFVHKALVAFAGLAFVVPVLWGMHTIRALVIAGALSGAMAAFAGSGRRRARNGLVGGILGGILAFGAGDWIAPVPMRMESGVFAKGVVGRIPSDTLRVARSGSELWAWTPVFAPSGLDDSIVHRWFRDDRLVAEVPLVLHGGRKEGFRTWSSSRKAASVPGEVRLEVWTSGGQLVGDMSISVR